VLKGDGGKKLRALALIAHVLHGTELSWKDPAKYSFAHGGKDGTPYPVDTELYDESVEFLREAVKECREGTNLKREALKKLEALTRFK